LCSLSLYSSLRTIAIAFVDANVVNVVVLSRIFMLFLHLCSSDDLNGRRSLRIVSVCVCVCVCVCLAFVVVLAFDVDVAFV
jgi:hypothetical protein